MGGRAKVRIRHNFAEEVVIFIFELFVSGFPVHFLGKVKPLCKRNKEMGKFVCRKDESRRVERDKVEILLLMELGFRQFSKFGIEILTMVKTTRESF